VPLKYWWTVRRHRRWMRAGLEPSQARKVEFLPFWRALAAADRARLGGLARIFEERKEWEGCGGQAISEEIKAVVAVQACRLVLRLQRGDPPGEPFPHVRTILVFPSSFRARHAWRREDGVVVESDSWNQGEAWHDGKVVLAWDGAYQGGRADDGRNLVIHEFAHQLDRLDGDADGLPPAPDRAKQADWRAAIRGEYARLRAAVDAGRSTLLDAYGATDPAEFFAVASEQFFEAPAALRRAHPALYRALSGFYLQDPLG
jgi:hypothetical protein